MIWSFSRDNGIPFSGFFQRIHAGTCTPLRTVWLSVVAAFLLGTPILISTAAFTAVVSISTIGLQISYGLPHPSYHSS